MLFRSPETVIDHNAVISGSGSIRKVGEAERAATIDVTDPEIEVACMVPCVEAALGITVITASVADAGADTFVAGSAIFGKPDYKSVIDAMRGQLAAV